MCCDNSFMSRATRPHRHLIYTRNAITTMCMQHAHPLGPTHARLARLQGFLSRFSSSHPSMKDRWKQAGPRHLSLPKRNLKFCVMRDGGRLLFSEEHTPKPSPNTFHCTQMVGQTQVYTDVYIHYPRHAHKYPDMQTKLLWTHFCLWFSDTQAIDTNIGSFPHSHGPLSKSVVVFARLENKGTVPQPLLLISSYL